MAISYIYPETGEAVEKEPWMWIAYYDDGTKLEQFEVVAGKAIFHRFDEIAREKLTILQLVHASYAPITISIPPDADPVHFYRNRHIEEEFIDEQGIKHVRTFDSRKYVIGFRMGRFHWLVYTDKYVNTIYSNDDKLFTDERA